MWWILKDICEALELSNSRMISDRLDEDDVSLTYIIDSLGRQQQISIINESGLYNVILLSRKPEAKKFKSWVTHEVLPSIRKHGAYITTSKAEELLKDPEVWAELLMKIKKEREEKERLQFQKDQLKVQIEEYKPKAVLADAISVTQDTILIRDLAKILKTNGIETGEKRLFEQLRQQGFLIKKDGADFNSPTQKAMELGLFTLTETAIVHHSGITTISKTSRVTGKGQVYFVNYFLSKNGGNNV
ncbi:antirepressor [Alphaproteobacteria bacterium]|nr:antirepressor [Alphaproteobacteria bacterium]